VFLALTKDLKVLLTLHLALSNCNTGISFHSVMQNIFITFEAILPQYLYTRNPFHVLPMKELIFSIL